MTLLHLRHTSKLQGQEDELETRTGNARQEPTLEVPPSTPPFILTSPSLERTHNISVHRGVFQRLTPITTIVTMSGILLAPYNDSMRLGQGYNSFLHAPCIYDAVQVNPDRVSVKPASSNGSTSQIVNYSSRFVDKISDVVKSLNVSAGASIKNGGIIGSSNTAALDETKFAASDLNAIVSVKVVNQTSELLDTAVFKPLEGITFTNETFIKVYGNCYISGLY